MQDGRQGEKLTDAGLYYVIIITARSDYLSSLWSFNFPLRRSSLNANEMRPGEVAREDGESWNKRTKEHGPRNTKRGQFNESNRQNFMFTGRRRRRAKCEVYKMEEDS